MDRRKFIVASVAAVVASTTAVASITTPVKMALKNNEYIIPVGFCVLHDKNFIIPEGFSLCDGLNGTPNLLHLPYQEVKTVQYIIKV